MTTYRWSGRRPAGGTRDRAGRKDSLGRRCGVVSLIANLLCTWIWTILTGFVFLKSYSQYCYERNVLDC